MTDKLTTASSDSAHRGDTVTADPKRAARSIDLMPQVYDRLRRLAWAWSADMVDQTLQPTALIHEAFLRLAADEQSWDSVSHFCAVASRAMRQVLTDHTRRNATTKRGGTWNRVLLEELPERSVTIEVDPVTLNDLLARLENLNARHCRIIELRFFAGLSVQETARMLSISPRTVKTDWRMARAWLLEQLESAE